MSAETSGFRPPGGASESWSWPSDLPQEKNEEDPMWASFSAARSPPNVASSHSSPTAEEQPSASTTSSASSQPRPSSNKRKRRHYSPRQCRICLDTVAPTFTFPSESLPSLFGGSEPTVSYVSSDGSRLLRPCKCRGSSAYVHDTCLQEWRHADPAYGARNFWQCPTCHFTYRLERMAMGRWLSSAFMQVGLTLLILWAAVFLLGFVADPIINLYFDPAYTITRAVTGEGDLVEELYGLDEGDGGWAEHFAKGFASLGLLGFAKVIFSVPWWHNIRLFGGGTRRSGSGRDRASALSTAVILIGVATFIYTVWKAVRAWSRRVLEKAGERVIDVHADDHDDDYEEEESDTAARPEVDNESQQP